LKVILKNYRNQKLLHCPENNNVCVWDNDENNNSNKWIFEKNGSSNRYVIRNIRSWLELHNADNNNVYAYQHIEGSNDWSVQQADRYRYGDGYYIITNERTGLQLHCDGNNNVCVWNPTDNSNQWNIIPVSNAVNVKSVRIVFNEDELKEKMKNIKPSYFAHQTCQYDGTPYKTTPYVHDTMSHESTLSFTETFGFSWSNTVTAGVEGIASDSTTIGINVEISSTQSITKNYSKEVGTDIEVDVKDKTLYAIIILKKAIIDLNFTIYIEFDDGNSYNTQGTWNGVCYADMTTIVSDTLNN